MDVNYRKITHQDIDIVASFMLEFYDEETGLEPMSKEKSIRTFEELQRFPEKGSMMIIEADKQVIGYCLLINYWSNEYAGNILHIDELFIREDFRGKSIGSNFLKHLIETRFADAVMLELEVTHSNQGARKLYEKLGFKPHKNEILTLRL